MELTQVRLTEREAEKLAGMVKHLLLNPELLVDALDDPLSAMQEAGLDETEIQRIADHLDNVAAQLGDAAFPWIS